ncbi:hypothetical protein MANES_03G126601v8 [Manihot esculenta]|uniref:Uncharacterized protein n=1 Tax=Manihot esculenta TaxID=3983 RepID=A0ACB7HZC5_MANES|nr:hypothetical protein MANES_03G126601v8 [Manihot esculenta]
MRMCVNPSNPMLFDFCWVWFIGEDSGCPEQCCLTFREFGLDWFWKGFIFFFGIRPYVFGAYDTTAVKEGEA